MSVCDDELMGPGFLMFFFDNPCPDPSSMAPTEAMKGKEALHRKRLMREDEEVLAVIIAVISNRLI